VIAAGLILAVEEGASERGVALEDGEQVMRRTQAGHVLRVAAALVREVDMAIRRERLEALRLALPILVRGNRHRPAVAFGIDLPHDGDLLGILVRQRIQDDGLDHAEDGGIGADAKGEREHGDQGERRLAAQGAEGVGEGGGPVGHGRHCSLPGSGLGLRAPGAGCYDAA